MIQNNDRNDRIIDPTLLAELFQSGEADGEPQTMDILLEIFFDTTPLRLEKMTAAAEIGDFRTMQRLSHTLKSSCAYLGALRMQSICAKIEELCCMGQGHEAKVLVQAIEEEFEPLKHALERAAANIRAVRQPRH